ERLVPLLHLLVDRPEMFGTATDLDLADATGRQFALQRFPQAFDRLAPLLPLGGDLTRQTDVVIRLEKLERQILQLGLDLRHTEAVSQRRVNLTGFGGDPPPTLLTQMLERPHVME